MTVLIPSSLDEALSMVSEYPDADLLTGGTDLMVEVNFNHRKPQCVIALRKVSELQHWSIDTATQRVTIGAAVPYADMETGPLAEVLPCLAEAARTVGSPQIRAAGTLGGNLGTCSPAGDGLPVLSATDATITLLSEHGSREVSFHDFMIGPKRNVRQPGEIIASVSMTIPQGWQGYAKVGVRNAMVISVASACLVINQRNSEADTAHIALGSVGPTIIRCRDAEQWWGSLPRADQYSSSIIREFGERCASEARPIDDHRSTASYRTHAISILASRLLSRGASS
jgi:CO/xanthine dehydrogenase FAD-binding subunit